MTLAATLQSIDGWAVDNAAAAVVGREGVLAQRGDGVRPFALASVTKPLVAYAVLVAVEEGSVSLDEPAGPPGATVRHLLAHTAGYGFESGSAPVAPLGTRRIYSNAGFEVLGEHFAARTGIAVADYLAEAVFAPLGMAATALRGSPAHGASGSADDLARFAAELLAPTLIAPSTLAEATSVQFPGLDGVLPGFGAQRPNDWGLGLELRNSKSPHWTGASNSPGTFGHFGGSGTFLWVDPVAHLACVVLTDRDFGPWAAEAWPVLSDAVLAAHSPSSA